MSKSTKRKHVTKEIEDNYDLPTDSQEIVKVLCGRGNNLHEVETATGERYLVSMPSKYRKNVWMKRGCYVVVEPIEEGNKVKAEIVHILLKDQIKYIREEGKWPEAFKNDDANESDEDEDEDSNEVSLNSDSSDLDLPANPNRPNIVLESDSESSSDDEEEENTSRDGDSQEEQRNPAQS